MTTPSSSARRALTDLGARLREIRVEAQLTGRDLANATGWHSSKVSRIEYGKQAPSTDDIRVWCTQCDATSQIDDMLASLRTVEGMYVEWWRLQRSGFQVLNRSLNPLWERTRRFHIYHPQLIPCPVQTQEYISSVLTGLKETQNVTNDVAAAVHVRLDRQRILHEGDHRFAILVEESVLRWPVGGPKTMTEQLRYLREATTLPAVALGIIPLDTDRSAIQPVEAFHIFDEGQVDVELVSGFLRITQPSEVAAYTRTFALLAQQAVYGAAARELITSALTALEQPHQ